MTIYYDAPLFIRCLPIILPAVIYLCLCTQLCCPKLKACICSEFLIECDVFSCYFFRTFIILHRPKLTPMLPFNPTAISSILILFHSSFPPPPSLSLFPFPPHPPPPPQNKTKQKKPLSIAAPPPFWPPFFLISLHLGFSLQSY